MVLLLNLLTLPFLFLSEHAIFKNISRRIVEGRKIIISQQEKARREERRNQMKVIVRAKLVVGLWGLIPMESGYDNSAEKYTDTVTKEN